MHLPIIASLASLPLALADLHCRPEGPIVPRPTRLQDSPVFQSARTQLTSLLDDAVSGTIRAGWDVTNSSFSLALVSQDATLWEYHHLSSANTQGTSTIDGDSQYLIGSITKVISTYIMLVSGVDIDVPVTDLLPTLNASESIIDWRNISLRALASHLSGAPANYGFSEYYYLHQVFEAIGFPPIDDSEYAPCGIIGLNEGCSSQQFLQGMTESYPITAIMERPAYSNAAYSILGLALEAHTGKNYSQLVQDYVAEPLGLQNTFVSPGNSNKAVIPPGESSWGADYLYNAPAGGLVSSLTDMTIFSSALLSHTLALTPAQTRQWLKPDAFTGGAASSAGMPWEIWRPTELTPAHPHPITLLGKGGGAQAYRSQMTLLEDYGVGVVALTAGPMDALTALLGAVLSTLVPAVDEVSRSQAAEEYAHEFTSCGNTSSVTIAMDNDSLLLSAMHRNGSDVLAGLTEVWSQAIGQYLAPIGKTVRLFPTELREEVMLHGRKVMQEVWRLWPQVEWQMETDLPGSAAMASNCLTWTIQDWVHYGGEPVDRVVFYRDGEGKVVGMEVPFLRTGLLTP